MQLPAHKTKIVCTIGPASRSAPILGAMIRSGMSVARLNFSHGRLEEHRADIRLIQKVAADLERPVTILIDLPGSKIRIGQLQTEPLMLTKGARVTLTTQEVTSTATVIPVGYKHLPESVSRGSTIYLNDGLIKLRVEEVSGDDVQCRVVIGGPLLSHKGLNLPGKKLLMDAVTARDLELVKFGVREGVYTFGLSFIRSAEDIMNVKEFARNQSASVGIVAKIERQEAIKNFDGLLSVADAVMIARGDLGTEIPLEKIPVVQKRLILKANLAGCPVITATQMLESMTENTRPTRAEVTDVANAILDGTDAVMLSEETAIGEYPVETVKMMAKIATTIERKRTGAGFSGDLRSYVKSTVARHHPTVPNIISLNAVEAAEALKVRYILTPTQSGSTARRISRFKPACWTLAFSGQERTCCFLAFSYGVYPLFMTIPPGSWHDAILNFVKGAGLVKRGDKVILTERRFTTKPGDTDSFGVITIE
jgi:pyruvate kinase